eukprot:4377980-Prymnesium_polylepis.1
MLSNTSYIPKEYAEYRRKAKPSCGLARRQSRARLCQSDGPSRAIAVRTARAVKGRKAAVLGHQRG